MIPRKRMRTIILSVDVVAIAVSIWRTRLEIA